MIFILPVLVGLVLLVILIIAFFISVKEKRNLNLRVITGTIVISVFAAFVFASAGEFADNIIIKLSGGYEQTKTQVIIFEKRNILIEDDRISFNSDICDGKTEKIFFDRNQVSEEDVNQIEIFETTMEIKNHFLKKIYSKLNKSFIFKRVIIPKGCLTLNE